jgi:hypothetical protein
MTGAVDLERQVGPVQRLRRRVLHGVPGADQLDGLLHGHGRHRPTPRGRRAALPLTGTPLRLTGRPVEDGDGFLNT